jgi:hypothetical protein
MDTCWIFAYNEKLNREKMEYFEHTKFNELLINIQELILRKLHNGTQVWCIQHKTLMIDTIKLNKYKWWLPMIVCILTLFLIEQVFVTHHKISLINIWEFCEPNINTLIEKWIPYDLLWPIRITSEINVMRIKGNKEYQHCGLSIVRNIMVVIINTTKSVWIK